MPKQDVEDAIIKPMVAVLPTPLCIRGDPGEWVRKVVHGTVIRAVERQP